MKNVETITHTSVSLILFVLYIRTKTVRFYKLGSVLAGKYHENYNLRKDFLA